MTSVASQKSLKVLSYGLISLKFLQEFLEAVIIGVVEESLLGEEEVYSARLE